MESSDLKLPHTHFSNAKHGIKVGATLITLFHLSQVLVFKVSREMFVVDAIRLQGNARNVIAIPAETAYMRVSVRLSVTNMENIHAIGTRTTHNVLTIQMVN